MPSSHRHSFCTLSYDSSVRRQGFTEWIVGQAFAFPIHELGHSGPASSPSASPLVSPSTTSLGNTPGVHGGLGEGERCTRTLAPKSPSAQILATGEVRSLREPAGRLWTAGSDATPGVAYALRSHGGGVRRSTRKSRNTRTFSERWRAVGYTACKRMGGGL